MWQTGKNEVGVGARRGQAAVQCGLNIAPSTHAASRPAWLSRLPPDKSCLRVHPAILQNGKETKVPTQNDDCETGLLWQQV